MPSTFRRISSWHLLTCQTSIAFCRNTVQASEPPYHLDLPGIRYERIDPPTLSPVQPRNSNPKQSLCHLGGLLQSAPSVPQIVEVVRSSGLHWSSTWQPCLWHDLQHRRALATSHEEHLAQRLTTFSGQKYHSVNRTRGWLLKCLTWNFESKCSVCLLSYLLRKDLHQHH